MDNFWQCQPVVRQYRFITSALSRVVLPLYGDHLTSVLGDKEIFYVPCLGAIFEHEEDAIVANHKPVTKKGNKNIDTMSHLNLRNRLLTHIYNDITVKLYCSLSLKGTEASF